MIVYDLICAARHRFEGWFPSAEGYAAQKESGELTCPVCGNSGVERLPSASRISRIKKEIGKSKDPQETPFDKEALVQAMIDYVFAHTEDVGGGFVDEARRMHYGEAPARNIRGVASKDETQELAEEGITVFQLPIPPREGWH